MTEDDVRRIVREEIEAQRKKAERQINVGGVSGMDAVILSIYGATEEFNGGGDAGK